jgi:uncharacterized membrane protein
VSIGQTRTARFCDFLIWLSGGMVLVYLVMGRPPFSGINGLDFPALCLGGCLLLRAWLAKSTLLAESKWYGLWLRLKQRPGLLTAGFTLAYGLGLCLISLLQHDRFLTSWDLGNFSQALWSTWRGEILMSSLRGFSLLGDHFHPMLFLLTPLYALLPFPQTLLVLQSLALASGAPAVYLLARRKGCGGIPAAGLAFLYLCHPGLWGANLFDFHVVVLACPLWLWHMALRGQRPGLAWLFAGLALICGEASWMVLLGLGLYDLSTRRWRRGLIQLVAGLGGFLLVTKLILPLMGGGGYTYVDRYSYLGKGITQIVWNMISSPDLVLEHLLVPGKIDYLLALLGGVMFLPLIYPPAILLFLPLLAGLILSDYRPQWSFDLHYSALLMAPLFAAGACGLERLVRFTPRIKLAPGALFALLLLSGLISMDASPMGRFWKLLFNPTPQAHEALAQVPPDAHVAAQECLAPHLTNRRNLYELPLVPPNAQYVVICEKLKPGRLLNPQKLMALQEELISKLGFGVLWQKQGCRVLKRR